MSEQKKKLVAYHEAGHAVVGALMPEYDPVTKISIVPRGNAGGLTFFAPSEERLESGLYSRTYLAGPYTRPPFASTSLLPLLSAVLTSPLSSLSTLSSPEPFLSLNPPSIPKEKCSR